MDNDEKEASSEKNARLKTRVLKPYPIYDQNGSKPYLLGSRIPLLPIQGSFPIGHLSHPHCSLSRQLVHGLFQLVHTAVLLCLPFAGDKSRFLDHVISLRCQQTNGSDCGHKTNFIFIGCFQQQTEFGLGNELYEFK